MKRALIAAAVALAPCYATAGEAQRPMSEMHGDCSNFSLDLKHEFDLWQSAATTVQAAAAAVEGAQALSTERLYEVKLLPHASVRFEAPPLKDRGGPDKFSGLVRLQVPADGIYGVAASNGLWIDVVDGRALVSADRFEMQTGCKRIFKIIEFPLRAGTSYWLQLNGNPSEKVAISITKRR